MATTTAPLRLVPGNCLAAAPTAFPDHPSSGPAPGCRETSRVCHLIAENSPPRHGRFIRRGKRLLTGTLLALTLPLFGQSGDETPSHKEVAAASRSSAGSVYIPLDSWIYPAAIRLYSLGYLPTIYVGLRPWTRASLAHMLVLSEDALRRDTASPEAQEIADRLLHELAPEMKADQTPTGGVESVYTRLRGIGGPILNDSYHLGQTVINDFGRPYQPGFNNATGYSLRGRTGRFSLYVRGEYQHAPSGTGYTSTVANQLADFEFTPHVPQSTVPEGPIPSQNNIRLLEANASAHLLGHEISFGKSDAWLGPAEGSSMAWSNNAENIYSFRINRVEPLFIPVLSSFVGLFRYDFFVGSLKGHAFPNDPWIHAEKISFKPTPDLEFGFERSVIWGGKGHVPITIHTFLRSFFSTTGVDPSVKFSRDDPGARFSTFDFTWRIPWQNHLLTIYTDSLAHDDVFPISNPGRAGFRPGVYLTRLPRLPRVDLRAEAVSTDPHDPGSSAGRFLYYEAAQPQGYTNKGVILGDWIGREGKGGQAWLTWHLRADEMLQLSYRQAKASSDFIPGGTTQDDLAATVVLRPLRDLEIKTTAQGDFWMAPLIANGRQRNVVGSFQLTYYPRMLR